MVDNRNGGANAGAASEGFNPKKTALENNMTAPDSPPSSGSTCPKCGYPTRGGEKKCPNCGASLSDDSGAAPSAPAQPEAGQKIGGTIIAGSASTGSVAEAPKRKLAGILATYSTTPYGEIFPLYEGRNYIGRDSSADIRINGDTQISGRHLSILYRTVDKKFKFRDEQSSNGTFVNDILTDEGELKTFDIICIGTTKLTFIAIPQ
jgi:hypothetical protein